jgi:hypothetical protein
MHFENIRSTILKPNLRLNGYMKKSFAAVIICSQASALECLSCRSYRDSEKLKGVEVGNLGCHGIFKSRPVHLLCSSSKHIISLHKRLQAADTINHKTCDGYIADVIIDFTFVASANGRSQRLRSLRHELSSPARTLESWFESHLRHGCLCAFILCLCCSVYR